VWPLSKPACHTVSIFTGRTKIQFSRIHSSALPYWTGIIFLYCKCPHTKFKQDYLMHLTIISSESLASFFLRGLRGLDSSFHKLYHKIVTKYKCIAQFSWNLFYFRNTLLQNHDPDLIEYSQSYWWFFFILKKTKVLSHLHSKPQMKKLENPSAYKSTIAAETFCCLNKLQSSYKEKTNLV